MGEIERKTVFYWASIAGADPEPVEVATVDGKRVAYTLGCPDPFPLGKGSPVKLGREALEWGGHDVFFTTYSPSPMDRPMHASEHQKQREKERIEWENLIIEHRWRGPR